MTSEKSTYVVNNIVLPIDASEKEAFSVVGSILKRSGLYSQNLDFSIFRRSTDARKKESIRFVYSVAVTGNFPTGAAERLKKIGFNELKYQTPDVSFGDKRKEKEFVIVGAGPCGLFCALLLAENGFKPILVERGGSVVQRKEAVRLFKEKRILDPNTNIQFGAGGAGTFSDGKLVTRINDPLTNYVMQALVRFGAPSDILYLARPHVGTDVLSEVVQKIIDRIVALGGKIMYDTRFIGYKDSAGRIEKTVTDKGEIPTDELILAVGHSARDTYEALIDNGISIEAKSFSVGMRIEHKASAIDEAMYGSFAGHAALGHAEYNLSYNTKERGVYTFCMCPGGVVVPSASEEGGVVTNGMSYHARNGVNSNSAVCCSIFKEDFGSNPRAAIEFQRNIERSAFKAGAEDYSAPVITVGDFLSDGLSKEPKEILPTYMSGGVKLASPKDYLPAIVVDSIKNGLMDFDKKIKGFANANAVLTGAETRTSAPVRILRNPDTHLAVGFSNLYPSGEGAGYAGGITSAAIDGLKTALAVMKKYRRG